MTFKKFMIAVSLGAIVHFLVPTHNYSHDEFRKAWLDQNQRLVENIVAKARNAGIRVPPNTVDVCDARSTLWNPVACYGDLDVIRREYNAVSEILYAPPEIEQFATSPGRS